MNRAFQWAATFLAVVCLVCSAHATVIHVPQEYATIQAGINAAVDGDTVLVADGTYTGDGNRDLDFGGVNMVVMSENGPEVTIIDCEGDSINHHRGFYFHNDEDSTSVVQGFTIRNGYAVGQGGGGIRCDGSSPRIEGNLITGNQADARGGGISCSDNARPSIVENTISGNQAYGWGGGGIGCYNASPIIRENMMTENTAPQSGGAITCAASSNPTIERNTITGNSTELDGGAISCYSSSPVISGNRIDWNYASDDGGGIWCESSSPDIIHNLFHVNISDDQGGAIACHQSSPAIMDNWIENNRSGYGGGIMCTGLSFPVIEGNMIYGNRAWNYKWSEGGGICCFDSSPTIIHNVIKGNRAGPGDGISLHASSPIISNTTFTENQGEAVYVVSYGYGIPIITNCILWGDVGPEISGAAVLTYCDVEGGYPGLGCIDEDPMFLMLEKNDCRLRWPSPCIDAGHPDWLDPDGTRSDMGAFFFDQDDYLTVYATPDSVHVSGGTVLGVTYSLINRWAQPEPFWRLAEAILPNGNAVNVMGPDPDTLPPDTLVQHYYSHIVPFGAPPGLYEYRARVGIPPATLYGQDKFTLVMRAGSSSRIWHVPEECPTIQAGIDSASTGNTVLVADGIYTGEGNRDLDFGGKRIVVESENGPEVTIIDCEGQGRGFYFHNAENLSCVVRGFTIKNGFATNGGGIYCGSASPTITDNIITQNECISLGAGIYCSDSSADIVHNTITGNTAGYRGGGVYCWSLSPRIENNAITENTADNGGGIYCYASSPEIEGNLIEGNTANDNGGGVFCRDSTFATIDGTTITGNTAYGEGGGIYCVGSYLVGYPSPAVTNSILWGDTGEEIHLGLGSSIDVTYSDVEGGWPGIGNLDADPLFVTGPLGDYYLSQIAAGQPEQSPCVDAGDHGSTPPVGTTRTDEEPDEWPVDMGYHYPLPGGSDRLR